MIGMMNVPCDSPAEFYAAPTRFISSADEGIDLDSEPSSYSGRRQLIIPEQNFIQSKRPSLLNLFNRRKTTSQVKYLQDGRKMYNGELMEVIFYN